MLSTIRVCVFIQLLDMCDLCVMSVVCVETSQNLSFEELTPEGAFGSVLAITLPSSAATK